MYRVDNDTASTSLDPPTAPGPRPNGYFTEGVPTSGIDATRVEAEFLNMLQEELIYPVVQAGLTLNKSDRTQLLQALRVLFVALTAKGNLELGVAEPTNPQAGSPMIFTTGLVLPATGPSLAFNAYASGSVQWSYLASGAAGVMGFNPTVGWEWSCAPGGTPGAVAPELGTTVAMALDKSGSHLTLSGEGIIYSAITPNDQEPIAFAWDGTKSALWTAVSGTDAGFVIRSTNAIVNQALNEIALDGATNTMHAYYPGGQVQWAATTSDRRTKSNLKPASIDALAVINQIPVHEADYTPPHHTGLTRHWDCALIADELAALVPPAYLPPTEAPRSYAAIDNLPLIATLIRAVQQLTAKVEKLSAA